ncbi:MAG: hypothetical protein DRJ51_00090 [Thermoprotei archaeon]|nr:MAG: hypothetical protein DRJ51_00090 [Thermoprotei archaeon]RLF03521.1 MAG: hypothetical protein DRJ59_00420 [Thermoprotei archaeon]
MSWTKIVELKTPPIKDVILVQGLPGLGLVGKIAVDYIITEKKLKKFAELYSNNLMLPDGKAGVIVNLYGVQELPRYEFFYLKNSTNDMVFVSGNTQPVSWAQYEIAEKVLEYLESKYGLRMVIAVCGTIARGMEGDVYIAANDEKLLAEYAKKYNLRVSSEGTITGACGLLPGLAKLHGIKGLSLMGAVGQIYPDPLAAKSVLLILDKILSLNIDYHRLDLIIEDIKKRAKALQRLQEKEPARPREEPGERLPWYYV